MLRRVAFSKAKLLGVIFSDQLSICIDDCTLRAQGFLRNKEEQKLGEKLLISVVSPVVNTGDTIAIFNRSGNTPLCSDESNKYLRGPQSFPKQCLITLKFISSAPELLFVFREKKGIFQFVY